MAEQEKKIDLETYPGFVSSLFSNVFLTVSNALASRNIKITPEFTFFFALLVYLFLDSHFFLNASGLGIIALVLLNLFIPNLSIIKKRFFKTNEEKINDVFNLRTKQEILEEFSTFLDNNSEISLKHTKLFTKKFPDSYEAYDLFFSKTSLSEEQLIFFLSQHLPKKAFFNDLLIEKFLKSCPIDIGHNTYLDLKTEISQMNISKKLIKYLNYKYCRYSGCNSLQITLIYNRERFLLEARNFFLVTTALLILSVIIWMSIQVAIAVGQKSAYILNTDKFLPILMLTLAVTIGITVILSMVNSLLTFLVIHFWISDKLS